MANLTHIGKGKNFSIFIENKENLSDFIEDISKLKIKRLNRLVLAEGIELSEEERKDILAKLKINNGE